MISNRGLFVYICAGLLMTAGIVLGVSTGWSLIRMSYYFWLSDFGAELGAGVLFIAGSLLSLPAAWLVTMIPEQSRSSTLASWLLCLMSLSVLLISTGLSVSAGLSHELRQTRPLNNTLYRVMKYESVDYSIRSAFANMQTEDIILFCFITWSLCMTVSPGELECCGVSSHMDWFVHRRDLPVACCGKQYNVKGTICNVPLYKQGCLPAALAELRRYLNTVYTFAYLIILISVITLVVIAYVMVNSVVQYIENRRKNYGVRIAYLPPEIRFPPNSSCLIPKPTANAPILNSVMEQM